MVIEENKFATVVSDNLGDKDLPQGTLVYVAGSYTLPDCEEDPYLYRKVFVVAKVVDDIIVQEHGWLVDGVSLEMLQDEVEVARLEAKRDSQVGTGCGTVH